MTDLHCTYKGKPEHAPSKPLLLSPETLGIIFTEGQINKLYVTMQTTASFL